ncbi:MAG: DUF4149 domain-containing protein [Gemmatimonadaceae bacterium]
MTRRAAPVAAALVLSAWLGAALFFSIVVAPAAFRTLNDVAAAGALVRATLPAIFDAGLVAGLVVLWLGAGGAAGPARTIRIVCGAGIAACCAACEFIVVRRIDQLRLRLATPIETLAPSNPARVSFDQLHSLSVGLLGVAMLLAVVAIVLLLRSGLASAVSPE